MSLSPSQQINTVETVPPLTWWQAAWRSAVWLIIILVIYVVAGNLDDTGQLGMASALLLVVGSGLFHHSFRVPILVLPGLVVALFLLLALVTSVVVRIS